MEESENLSRMDMMEHKVQDSSLFRYLKFLVILRYLLDPDFSTKQRSVTLLGTYLPPSQRRVKVVSFKISSLEVQPTSCWKFSCGVTAPKTKMTMEKQPFKDVFPIKTDDVPWLC